MTTVTRSKAWLCAKISLGALFLASLLYAGLLAYRGPYGDYWDLIGYVMRAEAGDYSWVFALHGEHWHISGQSLNLLIIQALGYSPRLESVVSAALGGLAVWFALPIVKQICPSPLRASLAAVACGVFLLSPDQWSNLLWGWHICVFVGTAASIGFTAAICSKQYGWRQHITAMGMAALAVYAHATALPLLVIGVLVLAFRLWLASKPNGVRLAHLLVWVVFSGLIVFHFFSLLSGLATPHQGVSQLLGDDLGSTLIHIIMFMMVFTGGAISGGNDTAAYIALALAVPVFIVLIRRSRAAGDTIDDLLPILVLIAIGFSAGLTTGLGRIDYGFMQGLVARYISVSNIIWLGLALWICRSLPDWRTARASGLLTLSAIVCVSILAVARVENTVRMSIDGVESSQNVNLVFEALASEYPLISDETFSGMGIPPHIRETLKPRIQFMYEKGWPPFDRNTEPQTEQPAEDRL